MPASQASGSATLFIGPRTTWLAARTQVPYKDQLWNLCGYNDATRLGDSATFSHLTLKHRSQRKLDASRKLLPALHDALMAGAQKLADFLAAADRDGVLHLVHAITGKLEAGIHLDELPAILANSLTTLRAEKDRQAMGEAIRQAVRLQDYPDAFLARMRRRKIIAVLGPTNSGKTYDAFVRLAAARDGVYLGPLRLLALEAYNRLNDEFGVPTSLLTGEDRRDTEGARVTASTIEMLNPDREVEVAVIDEIQMLLDPDRGWGWTQAVVGANAAELWLLGALSAEPAIRALGKRLGLEVEIRYKERKHPLSVAPRALAASPLASLDQAQKGDAWVVFSRRNALTLRDDFLARGKTVACIYGLLTPEVREREARRFAEGDADILVATDAIGMGLNLPIQRVVFTAIHKFNGVDLQQLDVPMLQQIGGRAGRYGHQSEQDGVVVGLTPNEHTVVAQLMRAKQPPLADRGFLIAPSQDYLERLAKLAGTERLEALLAAYEQHADQGDGFFQAYVPQEMLDRAAMLDAMLNLPLSIKHILALAPLSTQHEVLASTWTTWVRKVNRNEVVSLDFLRESPAEASLETAEMAVQQLWAYLWLSYRLPTNFTQAEQARDELAPWVDAVDNHLRGTRRQGASRQPGKAAWYRAAPM
ncbi:helicase-related protein [Achromobacter xylosoxidans]